MLFKVTEIEFDFTDDLGTLSPGLQEEVIFNTLTTVWTADDEDDLVEEITAATGWCVKQIDYVHVLS